MSVAIRNHQRREENQVTVHWRFALSEIRSVFQGVVAVEKKKTEGLESSLEKRSAFVLVLKRIRRTRADIASGH